MRAFALSFPPFFPIADIMRAISDLVGAGAGFGSSRSFVDWSTRKWANRLTSVGLFLLNRFGITPV
jgi:hypothetical protein